MAEMNVANPLVARYFSGSIACVSRYDIYMLHYEILFEVELFVKQKS